MGRTPGQLLKPSSRRCTARAVPAAQRRRWLQAALGLAGCLAGPLARPAPGTAARGPARVDSARVDSACIDSTRIDSTHVDFNADAFAMLGGRAALVPQGALYLSGHPDERDPHRLRELLAPDPRVPVRPALLAAIARDWRNHDVLTLDGWVLARSEARICALACLDARA